MYKLDLEKAEPEVKLPAYSGIEKRREIPKNVQTTVQLHSFHMLAM